MEIEKSLRLGAPPAQVWALLLDPQAMGACVPGMQSIEVLSADEYSAQMHVKVSFISARFKLRTRIVERREPHYLKAEGSGEDTSVASSLKQTTEMFLENTDDGGTDLRLRVKLDLLGRMGTFGLSVMKTKADRLWDDFGVNLVSRLSQAGAAPPLPLPLPTPPAAAAVASPPSPAPEPSAPVAAAALPTQAAPGWWPRLLLWLGIQPARAATETIVVELRRPDQTWVRIEWPASRAGDCARWLHDTLH